jgi:hypothetical protein
VIQSEDVIGETHSVCVMVLAPHVGLVPKQANENMRRVPRRGVDGLTCVSIQGARPSRIMSGEYELLGFSTPSQFWSQIGLVSRRVLCFMLVLRRRSVRGVGGGRFEGATHGLWNSR